jgi:hypothetical protein
MDNINNTNNIDAKDEKFEIKCEHCDKEMDLAKQDTCPHCNKSHFLEPGNIPDVICYADEKLTMYVSGGKNKDGEDILHKSTWIVDRYRWATHNELHVYIKENSEVKIEKILKSDCGQLNLDL